MRPRGRCIPVGIPAGSRRITTLQKLDEFGTVAVADTRFSGEGFMDATGQNGGRQLAAGLDYFFGVRFAAAAYACIGKPGSRL
jgi:hypothetical protein